MARRRTFITGSIIVIILIAGALAGWWYMNRSVSHSTGSLRASPPAQDSLSCIGNLPDTTRFAQKVMVAGYADQLSAEIPILAKYKVGGIILMDAASARQIAAFKQALGITPLVAVDQEGGTVQRYTAEGIVPGATDMAAGFTANQAYQKYLADDTYLKSLGITTNFAPVLGVLSNGRDPLPDRMFSNSPAVVTDYASAAIRAAKSAGITPVVKHFPGLGGATGNTDYAPATTDPLTVLQTRDILPYQNVAHLMPDVMVGNVIVPGLTNGKPAVWSSAAVQYLRGLGYEDAVVYTDSLTAQAIPGDLPTAVAKAWEAGADVALVVQGRDQTGQLDSDLAAFVKAGQDAVRAGTLKADDVSASLARIFARKGVDACSL